jgi:hypothetical protein
MILTINVIEQKMSDSTFSEHSGKKAQLTIFSIISAFGSLPAGRRGQKPMSVSRIGG